MIYNLCCISELCDAVCKRLVELWFWETLKYWTANHKYCDHICLAMLLGNALQIVFDSNQTDSFRRMIL